MKKKMLPCLLLTIVFIVMCSCSMKNVNSNNEKSVLPDTLVNHFPNGDKRLNLEYEMTNALEMNSPYVSSEFQAIYLVRCYKVIKNADEVFIEKEIANKAINTFKTTDTNYFTICSEEVMMIGHDSIELKTELSNHANDKSILGFLDVFQYVPTLVYDKTNCKLPASYKLYLMKCGETFVLPNEYKKEWIVLPIIKRHGYSCGVAISEKNDSIIYWTVAW